MLQIDGQLYFSICCCHCLDSVFASTETVKHNSIWQVCKYSTVVIFHPYLFWFPIGALEARKVLLPASAQMARWSPGEINLKVAIAAMSRTSCRMCRQSKRPRPHLRPSVPMEESYLKVSSAKLCVLSLKAVLGYSTPAS